MALKTFDDLDSTRGAYVIAEAGLNHNGSMEIARQLIDVAAVAGADAVKFQKRTIDILAVKETLDAKDDRFPTFGSTYREIREHLEFTLDEYKELMTYAEDKGLDFICTAFDVPAADFLQEAGVKVFKLASHSLTNIDLLKHMASLGCPVIQSTGMASLEEIDTAVEIFKNGSSPLALLHCVSAYPTPLELCNLKMLDTLKDRYGLPTGYSGHEIGYLPSVLAVANGAQMVERHYTLDTQMVGFDHKLSLEPNELWEMVRQIRLVPQIMGNGDKKVSETEMITRRKYHVSMASACPIGAGETLTVDKIVYRNPGTGIPPKNADSVMGKKAAQDIPEDVLITEEMLSL